jgi:hypothetical protein
MGAWGPKVSPLCACFAAAEYLRLSRTPHGSALEASTMDVRSYDSSY